MVTSVRPPGVRDINHAEFPSRCFWFYLAAVTNCPTLMAEGSLGFHQNLGTPGQTLQQTNSTDFSKKQSRHSPRNPTRTAKQHHESETLTPGAG